MRIEVTKDWCVRMAELEADEEIGVGLVAVDPVFDGESLAQSEEPAVAFGRFVSLMRRNRGLSVEKLADEADVDVVELLSIEEVAQYKPEVRTVYQLANFFELPRATLLQVAGLTLPKDSRIIEESVRFAARSEPVEALTNEERSALETFVSVLSEDKDKDHSLG
jgi:HTH-type transcriptional regulator, competence development regulator